MVQAYTCYLLVPYMQKISVEGEQEIVNVVLPPRKGGRLLGLSWEDFSLSLCNLNFNHIVDEKLILDLRKKWKILFMPT